MIQDYPIWERGQSYLELSIKLLGRLLDHFFSLDNMLYQTRVTIDRHNLVNQSLINRLALTANMHVQYKYKYKFPLGLNALTCNLCTLDSCT